MLAERAEAILRAGAGTQWLGGDPLLACLPERATAGAAAVRVPAHAPATTAMALAPGRHYRWGMMRSRAIMALAATSAVLVGGCGAGRPAGPPGQRPVASGVDRLGLLALVHPTLARTAVLVRERWRAHGDPARLGRGVAKRFGPARVFVTTTVGDARMTLYLYDTAAQATRIRQTLGSSGFGAGKVRTAGFCLYVGGRRLTPGRFDLLFDIAEARSRVG